jgi:phosphate transport system substrate-binding protein
MNQKKVDISSGCRTPIGLKGEDDVEAYKVAWSALVAIVNINNPVSNISLEEFKKILKGDIVNWQELGGRDSYIQVYKRSGKTSGVGYSARMALFKNKNESFTKNAKTKGSSGPIRRAVSKGIDAFAIDDYATSSKNKRVKILSIDGITPTKENIKNGKYKLYKPLYIYTNKKPTKNSKGFIDFALSDEGQKIIDQNGLVTLKDGKNLKIDY